MEMIFRFLKNAKDVKNHVFMWTEHLSKMPDMIECDKNGNPVSVIPVAVAPAPVKAVPAVPVHIEEAKPDDIEEDVEEVILKKTEPEVKSEVKPVPAPEIDDLSDKRVMALKKILVKDLNFPAEELPEKLTKEWLISKIKSLK